MKLIFDKKDPENTNVKIEDKGNISDFDYVSMLKSLLECGSLGESELKGDFTQAEKDSIASMVLRLNECVAKNKAQSESQKGEASATPVSNEE